jgi:NitT/TauT family transport system permease protein
VRYLVPRAAQVRRAAWLLVALVGLCLLWELYKLVMPEDGVAIGETLVLPRTDDASMPHIAEILGVFDDPEVAGAADQSSVGSAVASAAWYSFGLAAVGFVFGTLVGFALALLMQRVRIAERALMPWAVLSQTVPLIALAPLVYGWGANLTLFGMDWQPWMSVSIISAYLAFVPVTVGALRGLQSPPEVQTELLASYGASWWQTLLRLRLPAAVPFLIPALKLAAASAVIGAIVAEISTGLQGGIGRLIITYAQQATGEPAKVFAPIIGAAAMGIVAVGAISVADVVLRRYQGAPDPSAERPDLVGSVGGGPVLRPWRSRAS